ncbi:hypothetical protein QFZ40_001606 [Arthrobacter pascens]|uniref:NACHT domain-containing protein n=1 Tax=Arthrobacter pascens TaxID=1677 RepID=UPI0027844826|nr:hypothetical protein [Arthrobacter pascens]MDQ0633697.1 hypothetical protein [Arthrobacter pascens]
MGMGRNGTESVRGSAIRPNEAEQFMASLIVCHGGAIEELRKGGRRKSQDVSLADLWVPSASAIAVIVIAGREDLPLADAIALTRIVDGKHAKFTKAMENIAQDIAATLKGDKPFGEDWILQLCRGLRAGERETDALCSFGTVLSSGPATVEGLRRAIRDAERSRNSLLDTYLLDAAETLRELPVHYPAHLDVLRLAGVLRAGEVLQKSMLDQARNEGLYSDGAPALGDLHPALKLAAEHPRCILLADPGQGKTTVLQALVLDHVINDQKPALFMRLDDLGRIASERPPTSLQDAAEAVILASDLRLNFFCPHEARAALASQITDNPDFLLAFDGLDEVSLPERRAAVERVLHILARSAAGSITLSSRYAGYVRPPFIDIELGLGPMEDPEAFVGDWFSAGQPGKNRALEAIRSAKFADLSSIPLLAGFICYVAETEQVSNTKYGVYTQYIALFLAQKWKPRQLWRSSAKILERERIATELAWFMGTRPDSTPSNQAAGGLPQPSLALTISIGDWGRQSNVSDEMASFVEHDGLLVPHESKLSSSNDLAQPYRWIHRTIQEHLTGRALGELVEKNPDTARRYIRSALLRPTWTVILEHAAERINERGTLPRVIDDLLDFVDEGDVDDTLLRAAASLLTHCDTTHRRNEVIARLVDNGLFHSAFMLDPTLLREHLEMTINNMQFEDLEHLSYNIESWIDAEAFDEKWMPILMELDKMGLAKAAYLGAMAKLDQNTAEKQAIDLLIADPFKNTPYRFNHVFQNASTEAITSLLEAAKKSANDYPRQHEFLAAAQYAKHPSFRDLVRATFELHQQPHEALLYFADPHAQVPWDLLDLPADVISASLHNPQTPPEIASAVARFCPPAALEPFRALSPWARIGAWARPPEINGRPDFPSGWSATRANEALARLLGGEKDAPGLTVEQIEEYHIAVQWGMQHPGQVQGITLLEVVRLNDNDLYPRYWWMGGIGWLPYEVGLMPTSFIIQTLRDAISDSYDWTFPLTFMMSKVVSERSFDEMNEVLSALLTLAGKHPDKGDMPVRGWYSPQNDEQATTWALRFLDFAAAHAESKQLASRAIKTAVSWLHSHGTLPTHWAQCIAIHRATHSSGNP